MPPTIRPCQNRIDPRRPWPCASGIDYCHVEPNNSIELSRDFLDALTIFAIEGGVMPLAE